jgi:hypothetical protein
MLLSFYRLKKRVINVTAICILPYACSSHFHFNMLIIYGPINCCGVCHEVFIRQKKKGRWSIQAHERHTLCYTQHVPKNSRFWENLLHINNNYYLCDTERVFHSADVLLSPSSRPLCPQSTHCLLVLHTYRRLSRVSESTPTFFCFCYDMPASTGKLLTVVQQHIYILYTHTQTHKRTWAQGCVCFEIWNTFLISKIN